MQLETLRSVWLNGSVTTNTFSNVTGWKTWRPMFLHDRSLTSSGRSFWFPSVSMFSPHQLPLWISSIFTSACWTELFVAADRRWLIVAVNEFILSVQVWKIPPSARHAEAAAEFRWSHFRKQSERPVFQNHCWWHIIHDFISYCTNSPWIHLAFAKASWGAHFSVFALLFLSFWPSGVVLKNLFFFLTKQQDLKLQRKPSAGWRKAGCKVQTF